MGYDELKTSYGHFRHVERLLTTAESRLVDELYPHHTGIQLIQLMELAGAAVARETMKQLSSGDRVTILCGGGQNGGDGWVAARVLWASGMDVAVCDTAKDKVLPDEASLNREAAKKLLIPEITVDTFLKLGEGDVHVVIDALFGSGLTRERPLSDLMTKIILHLNHLRSTGTFVLSVDLPSGVDATTGAVSNAAVNADLAVTFVRTKAGQMSHPGVLQQTSVAVERLGVPASFLAAKLPINGIFRLTAEAVGHLLPPLAKDRHKGMGGKAGLIGGSKSMPGAAVLAARAMAMSGAGYVTIVADDSVRPLLVSSLPEALYAEADDSFFDRMDVVAYGPGLGIEPPLCIEQVLNKARHLVIDADGLRLLSALDSWQDRLKQRPTPAVLTPHVGEFRLLHDYDPDDRIGSARQLAEKTGSIVVLKGMSSVIAAPDGTALLSTVGNPGLAKGGSGDVLTGLITGLLATGLTPLEAAAAGVYCHGKAADLATARRGERAMLPQDVIETLPEVLRAM